MINFTDYFHSNARPDRSSWRSFIKLLKSSVFQFETVGDVSNLYMTAKKYHFSHEFLVLFLILPDKFLIEEAEKLLTGCNVSYFFSNSRKLNLETLNSFFTLLRKGKIIA